MDKDAVLLHAAMASRVENQDAIDASIVGMLGDPKEVFTGKTLNEMSVNLLHIYHIGISEVRFFFFCFVTNFAGKSRDHRGAFPALQPCGKAHCNHLHRHQW